MFSWGCINKSINIRKHINRYLAETLVVFRDGSGLNGRRVVVVCGLLVVVLEPPPPPQGSVLQSRDSSLDPRHLRPPRLAWRRMDRNLDCAPEPHDLEQAPHWPKGPHSQSAATNEV